ncbi:MAG: hemolysin family protein [Lachnospiraceae bacterium]|nr:hemolysin family protein [Lachnospiraceae bacterium]
MDNTNIIQSLILLVLILLSAFFSSAETALSSISEIKVRSLAENGDRRSRILQYVVDHYGKMLSAILIGNNLANISASSLATTITIRMFGNAAVGIATGLLTFVVLIFGEIVPKNAAKIKAEKVSLFYAPLIYGLMWILTPFIWVIDKFSKLIMILLRIDPDEKSAITEAELRTYVDVSHEDGVIETDEKKLINNVFDFSDSIAREIMIPNIDMVVVSVEASYEEIRDVFRTCMYTRLPVYENERDNIIGLVNIKDFIFVEDQSVFNVRSILRSVYYTYEFKKTSDLLLELRETANPLALVISEYGACVGMVTIEDLLEEIVGEIRDEYDEDEADSIKKVEKNVYLIDGSRKLDDVNDALGTTLDSDEYDSIAGLILEHLDRMPQTGDEVRPGGGCILKVNEVVNNRITRVRLTLPESTSVDS